MTALEPRRVDRLVQQKYSLCPSATQPASTFAADLVNPPRLSVTNYLGRGAFSYDSACFREPAARFPYFIRRHKKLGSLSILNQLTVKPS
jgi:hypothetical protein